MYMYMYVCLCKCVRIRFQTFVDRSKSFVCNSSQKPDTIGKMCTQIETYIFKAEIYVCKYIYVTHIVVIVFCAGIHL